MINNPSQQSQARQPRGLVKVSAIDAAGNKISGEVMPPALDLEVTNNTFGHADNFRLVFAVSAMPADRREDWWAAQNQITVEIYAGLPADPENFTAADLDLLIVGNVDEQAFDPTARTIELHGRDLTALLIDTSASENFLNRLSSDVATTLALRHDLTPQVTKTAKTVGGYYKDVVASLSHGNKSEWDILCELANLEGFVVYVKGRTLYFGPQQTAEPYPLTWHQPTEDQNFPQFFGTRLSFSKRLHLSGGIIVKAANFNMKTGKTQVAFYPPGSASKVEVPQASKSSPQLYTVRAKPSAMPDQLMQIAKAKYDQVLQHEMNLSTAMPADNVLSAGMQVTVSGTGTAFDQRYFVCEVTRRLDMHEGYTMRIEAKNIAPESQVTA